MVKILFSVFILFSLSNLYSCSPSGVLASGGATTMVVAEGDRTLGTVVDDATIKINIAAKFRAIIITLILQYHANGHVLWTTLCLREQGLQAVEHLTELVLD